MKKCLPSLATKEMAINNTPRFYLITPVTMATIKSTATIVVEIMGKRNPHTLF
jgi:hypothetical protein